MLHRDTSAELTTKKGCLSIIHGNYRRLLKTANSVTLDSLTLEFLSFIVSVIELRLPKFKYRKMTVKVIADFQVLSLIFKDILYFAALPLRLTSKNHKHTRIIYKYTKSLDTKR